MSIYDVVSWVVFGLVVGLIARFLVPGKQPIHWMLTVVLGIVGSFVGGGISWLLFGGANGAVNPGGWVMSILGAIILVLVYSRIMTSPKVTG